MSANIETFLTTLPVMAKGLGGIFAVMAVIYVIIVVLNKASNRKKEN